MGTKICTKCKKEQDISCFSKDKSRKGGLGCWCRVCKKQYNKDNSKSISKSKKQYYKDNREPILEQRKQFYKDNIELITIYHTQYNIEHSEQKAEYNKKYYVDNVETITKQQKQYNKDNAESLSEKRKQYQRDNAGSLSKQRKRYNKYVALFETYFERLEIFENVRRCFENKELLEVKCAYCGRWMQPSNSQVTSRIAGFNSIMCLGSENRFYCSDNCKQACPIYRQRIYPKDFKKATSSEVVPLLRQLVLERDDYTCQKCGATTETAQLHVYHEKSYTLNKIMANDPDNCITLCKNCHKRVHSQEGCKYSDLKC